MSIRVRRAGLLTTVQDLGRPGYQRDGVPESGAMDRTALRLVNLLVGNDEGAAGLEVTLDGPVLLFEMEALVAIGGADLDARVDGRRVPPWRAVRVAAASTLEFGGRRTGCRAYIAVAGGIEVPPVLGSRSTYLPARFGGLGGRALRRDDVLRFAPPAWTSAGGVAPATRTRVARRGLPAFVAAPVRDTVRFVPGPHLDLLTPVSRGQLFDSEFRVTPRSDRMGYRLSGPPLALATPVEPLSAGVAFGTIQLPPGADPIVLMADRQTTGGYPRLGEIAAVDLSAVAQLRPGDVVRFSEISLASAQALYLERERTLGALRHALSLEP